MSAYSGKVGPHELEWLEAPRGSSGSARVRLNGKDSVRVSWVRDADGIWLQLPDRVVGFDISGRMGEDDVLGFRIAERTGPGEWNGLSFRRSGESEVQDAGAGARKGVRVRAQMPGKIIRVLAGVGDEVAKDQPLLVMEAMKMENEIRAPSQGVVKAMKVKEGQAVESGAELLTLE